MEKLRIVVGGFIGLWPSGGVTWDYIQYPLGLKLLGHDVYYIEDTASYPVYNLTGEKGWDDATDTINYLKETMEAFGFADRWAYRDIASGNCFGLSHEKVLEICSTADVFINVSAATYLKDEYLKIPKRILIDSDPMFTQVQDWDDATPEESYEKIRKGYSQYNYLFSFGENIGKEDCRIPTYDLDWRVTRQPICINYWPYKFNSNISKAFTTIMNWSGRAKMKYKNEEWGQKDVEFKKFKNIPNSFKGAKFQVIVADNSKKLVPRELEEIGWQTFDPLEKIRNVAEYKSFIENSFGEFSVAKETYVKSNSGWFSCRSACYLAAGKPVITQDTMWSKYIPSGEGLMAFTDEKSAIESLEEITSNPFHHSKRAREIACEYFDSDKVLQKMLQAIN